MAIIFVVVYVVAVVVFNVLSLLAAASFVLAGSEMSFVLFIIYFSVAAFCILADILLLIKYSVTICRNYDKKRGIINLIKLIAFPIALMIISIIWALLLYAKGG